MCGGGLTEMQSRRTPRFHEEMKQTFPHAASAAASCFSPRPHPPAPPPAGLAIVAALEAELAQSHASTSCTKAAESAAPAASPTSSLPIPIISPSSSTAYDHHDHEPQYMIISRDKFSEYFHNQIRDHSVIKHHTAAAGTPKSIFSTSLSPPSCNTYNYIMSCNFYRDQLLHDDFLCFCFSCKRPLAPGKDIYMYRGDRAFCSTECRHKHMVADELSLPCTTVQINQQCVQASSPTTKQPTFKPPVAIAILV